MTAEKMPEKFLFIPRQRVVLRRESVAIDWLIYDAGGEVCIWFDTRAMIFALPPDQIPTEIRNKGELFATTDVRRLDDLIVKRPDLELAVGTFLRYAQRRVVPPDPFETAETIA